MIKFAVILCVACAVGLVVGALWYPPVGGIAMFATFFFLYRL
jgi:hypothetical protein